MAKLTIILIKNAIKVTLDLYAREILIYGFITVEIITISIVLWETFTGKSIVDVIWDAITKDE
ncbi:MAG: hypothetical protein K6F73_07510 [Lachnospiraceae bacterium]|nr:hypothetical protein [Lachnospiraceae bacterium]